MPFQTSEIVSGQGPGQIAWDLDWNLLRTFMVIVQEGSISAAARRLDLKQPTVSNALKRLETGLAADLIRRGPKSFDLTRRGERLYEECAAIFGSVNRLSCILEETGEQISGTVKLALASHVASPLFDETLARFNRLHPATCLSIEVLSSKDVIRSVQEKASAIGVCLVRDQVPELNYQLIYTEHFGFYCGPRHRLFGRKGLRLRDLKGERCVSFHTDQLNDVLKPVALLRARANFDAEIAGVSSNLEEVRRMVIAGLGIGSLPIHVVERDVSDGLLFRLPPYRDPPQINIWMVHRPDTNLNRAEQAFLHLLQQQIESTPMAERIYGGHQSNG